NVDMWVNVDREMACKLADALGVERPTGNHVPVNQKSPAVSQMNAPFYAFMQKVGVLIGDGCSRAEVRRVLGAFEKNGVFYDIISNRIGPIMSTDGMTIEANETVLTKHPVLYDTLYVVGGNKDQVKFNQEVQDWVNTAYKYYKPIGVATTGNSFIRKSDTNNLAGVVFASDNPDFPQDFIKAIAKQRFWDRT